MGHILSNIVMGDFMENILRKWNEWDEETRVIVALLVAGVKPKKVESLEIKPIQLDLPVTVVKNEVLEGLGKMISEEYLKKLV